MSPRSKRFCVLAGCSSPREDNIKARNGRVHDVPQYFIDDFRFNGLLSTNVTTDSMLCSPHQDFCRFFNNEFGGPFSPEFIKMILTRDCALLVESKKMKEDAQHAQREHVENDNLITSLNSKIVALQRQLTIFISAAATRTVPSSSSSSSTWSSCFNASASSLSSSVFHSMSALYNLFSFPLNPLSS